jgi:hypothetical protein
MQTKRDFIKTGLVLATVGSPIITRAAPVTKWLTNNMPHYHEFNPAENPGHYGWCGHTALKIAGQYLGQTKTLTQIHNIFYANSLAYRQNRVSAGYQWCASLADLMMATGSSANGGYGRTGVDPWKITTASSATDFFTKIKNAINNNWPVIVPSDWFHGPVGHFWVVCGYTDFGTLTNSALYLRDVVFTSPVNPNADRNADVLQFYNLSFKQMLIMK